MVLLGCSNPSLFTKIHKVTFLSVHSSAQIGYSGGSPSGRGPGVSCRSIDIPFSVLRSFPAFAD